MKQEPSMLDFRSDTVTTPSPGMRKAMQSAQVGDDVFQEDPTVNRLEREVAELFGREASLFVSSGTMANLIGMALHCQRGDEVILERRTHSFCHEVGGGSALLGVVFHPLDCEDGILSLEQVQAAIRPKDIHEPNSRLLMLENTANLAGGLVLSYKRIRAFREWTHKQKLSLHMDGARIWNAAIQSKTSLDRYASQVDTLSCCFSKGMGCPVGSMLIGDRPAMVAARRIRKMLGGGMRQAGMLAAAALYALEHHLDRISKSHEQAEELYQGLVAILDEQYRVQKPQTNILLVHTNSPTTTKQTLTRWKKLGILALALSDRTIRLVTHLDIPLKGPSEAIRRMRKNRW